MEAEAIDILNFCKGMKFGFSAAPDNDSTEYSPIVNSYLDGAQETLDTIIDFIEGTTTMKEKS